METKKNNRYNLLKYKGVFFLTGLCISTSLVLFAFEYKTIYTPETMGDPTASYWDNPEIPITEFDEPEPPKPKKQFQLVEVDDVEEVIEEIEIDIDFNETDVLDEITFEEIKDEEVKEEPFVIAEVQASFPGGTAAWGKYLRKNLKYPRQAQRMGIEGKVQLSFLVDASGNISDIKVVRGIGDACNNEAVRVLKNSPQWNPGLQRGRPVKSPMSIFIHFILK
ncbi:protein TonB [Roseivirga pacifica]|uniref:Protein TonB n=1 Tax=Roseivirga pacifica TaxID=1267423 RepID=A0A1I0RKC0_9BACT|nr:energy transducer TonB [Roseivirga pacifica]RKQ49820.1 protein TonB [Roseivirga pacifica]SEW41523.1 protein TonB [Roseivirga pacifica]